MTRPEVPLAAPAAHDVIARAAFDAVVPHVPVQGIRAAPTAQEFSGLDAGVGVTVRSSSKRGKALARGSA